MELPSFSFNTKAVLSSLITGIAFIILAGFNPNFAISLPMAISGGLIVIGFIAPILEELFFRFVALYTIQDTVKVYAIAVLIQAALFSLFHWYVYGGLFANQAPFLGAFVFGCTIPLLIHYNNGNLMPAMLAHGMFNLYLASKYLLVIGL